MADEGSSTTSTEYSASTPELHNSPKKIAPPKAMKRKVKQAHPSTAEMVNQAITQLGERNGSSLPAIKKFIMNTYLLDVDKHAIYIKKYLKSAVAKGSLVQTKGRGASGSFKMPPAKQKTIIAKEALEEQKVSPKKSAAPKKIVSGKVAVSTRKQASSRIIKKASSTIVVQKTKSAKQIAGTATSPKSPSRTKRTAKSPTSKPNPPKPRKVSAAPKSPRVLSLKKMTAVK